MSTLYESIKSLCDSRGISGAKMCLDIGASKSLMTGLKTGRTKTITSDTAQKIANYFGVSVNRVLTGKAKSVNDFSYLQLFAEESNPKEKPVPEDEPNKSALIAAIENMSRDELLATLEAVTQKLKEK